MDLEKKANCFEYIRELERMGVAPVTRAEPELRKRFPDLTEAGAQRLISLYIQEEVESKPNFLTE